jgi:tRNA-modifying protein YgfZ
MTPTGLTPLPHLGLIRAEGPDAATFLHNQLSQDITGLGPQQACLAAFCSAKGRMLASFYVLRPSNNQVLLVCQRDLLEATLKRLRMFVLRSKVVLTDATADFELLGWCGPVWPNATNSIAASPLSAWALASFDQTMWLSLPPSLGQPRGLRLRAIASPGGDSGDASGLPTPSMSPVALNDSSNEAVAPAITASQWQWAEVCSGVVLVSAASAEALVPQMLNYESVGGVNFKKGCYPGQEVVARSQFRGTLKRRGFLAHADEALAAGDALFYCPNAKDKEAETAESEPCGVVVAAAPTDTGGWDAMVSMQVAASSGGSVYAAQGERQVGLNLLELPYALAQDI